MDRSWNLCTPDRTRSLAQHLHWPARKISFPRRFLSLHRQCARSRRTRPAIGAPPSCREMPSLAHRLFAPHTRGVHYASVGDARYSSLGMQLGIFCTAIAWRQRCRSTFWLFRLPMHITPVWFCRLCPAAQPAHLHGTGRRPTRQWMTRQPTT